VPQSAAAVAGEKPDDAENPGGDESAAGSEENEA
jgi:hypothetical protein